MRAFRSLVCGFLAALIVGGVVFADGGFPSQPIFYRATLGYSGTVPSPGTAQGSLTQRFAPNTQFATYTDGTREGIMYMGTGADALSFGTETNDGIAFITHNLPVLTIDGSGNIALGAHAGTVPWGRRIGAIINTSASSCTVSASGDSFNVTSCSRAGAGIYNVTLNSSFGTGSGNPVCVATIFDGVTNTDTISYNPAFSQYNVVQFDVWNSSGTRVDASGFSFTCE